MNDQRYKELMIQVGMPESNSLLIALKQVANEVEQSALKNRTDIELLRELVRRNGSNDAGQRIEFSFPHRVVGIKMGRDNTAHLYINTDAFEFVK